MLSGITPNIPYLGPSTKDTHFLPQEFYAKVHCKTSPQEDVVSISLKDVAYLQKSILCYHRCCLRKGAILLCCSDIGLARNKGLSLACSAAGRFMLA